MILTCRYRVKDATVGKKLNRHAWACNQVWNYCCQIQREAEERWKQGRQGRWPSAFDLIKLCTGAGAALGLHSDSVQTICRQFAISRDAKKRSPRFRASGGPKRALGWVPFIPRAKIANARRHHLHGQSTTIARQNQLIVVGNVSAAKLTKTKMAKSILDASWTTFRGQLAYKARRHNAVYIEADERCTSQTCSCCGSIPDSSPKGMGALGIRHWTCSECGSLHDRDVNAALNILRVGLERQPLVEEIPVL